jgi:hypothetical protein
MSSGRFAPIKYQLGLSAASENAKAKVAAAALSSVAKK